MLPPSWFDNMYAAQCLWDVVMARSILDRLPEGHTMVVVVGAGHVAYGLGIPQRLAEERRRQGLEPVDVLTFCPVTAPAPAAEGEPSGHPMGGMEARVPAPQAQFVRSLADFVKVFANTGGVEAYPQLGVSLTAGDHGGALVKMVFPDTIAASMGLQSGDRVLDCNGTTVGDVAALRLMLAHVEWRQRLDLAIERNGENRHATALLFPAVETHETTVAPGWKVEPVAPFDAAGSAPVVVVDEQADEISRQRVSCEGWPKRVEVRSGKTLVAVHELDDNQRVVRSLFREPQPDGAVDVRFSRGPAGEVLTTTRMDRNGAVIPSS